MAPRLASSRAQRLILQGVGQADGKGERLGRGHGMSPPARLVCARPAVGARDLPPGDPLPPSPAAAHHLLRRVDSLSRHFERMFYTAGQYRTSASDTHA